jgi:hypothetical protein
MRFGAMCSLHRCNSNSIAILQIVIKALSFTFVQPNLLPLRLWTIFSAHLRDNVTRGDVKYAQL